MDQLRLAREEGGSKSLGSKEGSHAIEDFLLAQARDHARMMLEAEMALGRVVIGVGLCRVDALAKALGVRRNMLVDAATRAQGLIRSHGKLEREVAQKEHAGAAR
jgi:hypothetical protein